jgi:uncharacterized membrane protein
LLVYAVVGLGLIAAIARAIGFRDADRLTSPATEPVRAVAVETAEIVFQSLLATYVGLLALGILQVGDPIGLFARLGLLELVPLELGAAIANRLVDEGADSNREGQFPRNLALFAAGATFVSLTIAPTEEVRVLAARTGPIREVGLVSLSIGLTYLALYVLAFNDQGSPLEAARWLRAGTTLLAYAVGVILSFVLLAGYGCFVDTTSSAIVQQTIVLSFPASLGAAGAEVLV